MLQLLCAYRFKACRYGGCVLMQQRKYKSCNGVFLKSIAACAGHGYRQETADAYARFKKNFASASRWQKRSCVSVPPLRQSGIAAYRTLSIQMT